MTLRYFRLGALATLLAAYLTACGPAPSPTPQAAPPRSPAPLPSGATALTLTVAPAETVIPVHWVCAGNTVGPTKVVRRGDGLVFISQPDGPLISLVWPRGFSARLRNGLGEVVAPDGTVILHEGEVFSGIISGVPDICEVSGVGYPPAS